MNGPLNEAQQRKLYWWAVFLYFGLLSANSLFTATLASLVGTKWDAITTQEKFLIVISILANWTGLVLAFVRSSIGRIVHGKPPIETGDTERIQRT